MKFTTFRRGIKISGSVVTGGRGGNWGVRSRVSNFSKSSRRRLQWIETQGNWVSMLTLTYHSAGCYCDENGVAGADCSEIDLAGWRNAKKQLNSWLQILRNRGIKYLWCQEFQVRGVLHFHVLMDMAYPVLAREADNCGVESWRSLMWYWIRLVGEENDKDAVDFCLKSESYTPWKIYSDGYLSKYMDKNKQKVLPDGVKYAGRWWGCSRDLWIEERSAEVIESVENMEQLSRVAPMWRIFRRQVRKFLEHKYKYKFSFTKGDANRPIRAIISEEGVVCVKKLFSVYVPGVSYIID